MCLYRDVAVKGCRHILGVLNHSKSLSLLMVYESWHFSGLLLKTQTLENDWLIAVNRLIHNTSKNGMTVETDTYLIDFILCRRECLICEE